MDSQNKLEERGYNAGSPWDIPFKGWKDIILRLKDKLKTDYVSIFAAGVAFYFFLALFPAIAAVFSIYGLVVDVSQVQQQLTQAADMLPEETYNMIFNMLTQNAEKSSQALGWSLILGILISLWSANKATSAIFEGINMAYHEIDNRGFIKQKALTLAFTLGTIIIGLIAMATVIAFPALVDKLNVPPLLQNVVSLLRWLILGGIVYLAVVILYRFAPDRATSKTIWLVPGALFTTVVWIGGSLLFTFYINNFGSYDQTYGSIAAVIILLLWFFLTGFIIILGAEINSEIEHHTRVDPTTGTESPLGKRGAYYADHWAGDKEKQNLTGRR